MLNEFLAKFKKVSFSQKAKDIISKFDSFSVKVDREAVSVAVMTELSCYVKPSELFLIEDEIKKAYALNSVRIFPHYNIEFKPQYMDGVIETLKHISQLDYGFFDQSTYHYDSDTGIFIIKFRANITSDIPEANGAELFIMQCVRDQFGLSVILRFEYDEINPFEYVNERENALAASIRETKFEIANEQEKEPPRASFANEPDDDAEYSEKYGKRLVTVGKMTLDITEPEPVFGERRNWNFTPISLLKNDTGVCVAGKLFLVESKENYEGEKNHLYNIYNR